MTLNAEKYLDRNEAGDAELLAQLYTGKLVFDHSEGVWYRFANHHWEPDQTGEIYSTVYRELPAAYLDESATAQRAGNDTLSKALSKRARALTSRGRIENVIYLAARPSLGITGAEWDNDPYLLGVENGVLDLRTQTFRDGKPEDFIRSVAPVEWRGIDTPCPRWERFLEEIFDSDQEIGAFVQRLLGYGITGLSQEHILPIFWGETGRNGKGTLFETLGDVLGNKLAVSSQADAIMDAGRNNGSRPQPFVYALRDKRVVWCSESNVGRRLNSGLVKQLTGGDRLHVRTLHSKPIEFKPSHLLVLLTNHCPNISEDDWALWERVLLVPFTVRFVDHPSAPNEKKREPDLKEKLRSEASGILAWLVRGYVAWQNHGLCPPDVVMAATNQYQESESVLARFISECCLVGEQFQIQSQTLYRAFEEWADRQSLPVLTMQRWGRLMKTRYSTVVRHHVTFYLGIGLQGKISER